jgi:hypothetical protein
MANYKNSATSRTLGGINHHRIMASDPVQLLYLNSGANLRGWAFPITVANGSLQLIAPQGTQ